MGADEHWGNALKYVLRGFLLSFAVSCALLFCSVATMPRNMSLWLIFVVVLDSDGKSRYFSHFTDTLSGQESGPVFCKA